MSSSLTLTPRYGRDFKSKAEVIEAWNGGLDFTVMDAFHPDNGRAVSIRESAAIIATGRNTVHIRYKGLAMIAVIPIKPVMA